MHVHQQTIFYAEYLQTDWLALDLQQTVTWLAMRLPAMIIGGCVGLLVFLLVQGLSDWGRDGSLLGLGGGLSFWIFQRLLHRMGGKPGRETSARPSRQRGLAAWLTRTTNPSVWQATTALGVGMGLSYGLNSGLSYGLNSGLNSGLGYGLSVGLIVGLNEGLSQGLNEGLIIGLIIGLIEGLIEGLSHGLSHGLIFWLLLGLYQGMKQEHLEDQDRQRFNQGIRRSLRNGLLLGLISAIIISMLGLLSVGLSYGLSHGLRVGLNYGLSVELSHGPSVGLSYGLNNVWIMLLIGTVVMWALSGGLTILRHYVIRWLLARHHTFPFRAQAFLDDATARILLRRVGGGYSFIHRRLQDYFAEVVVPPS